MLGERNTITCAPSAAAAATRILDAALTIVRVRHGIDFTGYRRATLERRLLNRLIAVGATSAEDYLERLRTTDGEVGGLVTSLTVKMSRFYRNAAVFDALRDGLLTDLRARFAPGSLRLWSAGCAHGEEAYTLAMLLEDGDTVWATDIDDAALVTAQPGRYAADAFAELPPSLAHLVETPADTRRRMVAPHIKRRVRFERHDVTAVPGANDARFHLVSCRNVLIYFDASLQHRVIRGLIDRVLPGGLLCLGEAEWLGEHAASMEPVDRKLKIFRRPLGGTP